MARAGNPLDLRRWLDEVRALGTPYVMELLGITVGPARIHCALLGLETTQKAIDETPSR